jgi:amidase
MRLPNFGMTTTMFGSEQMLPTLGPLSTSLEGCRIFMKTIIDAKPWLKEPSLLPFPWNEGDAFKGRKPKIAVFVDDGVVKPHPPVTLALNQVVEKLKANGNVEIVEWIPYKHDEAWAIIVQPPLHLTMDITDSGRQTYTSVTVAPKTSLPWKRQMNLNFPSRRTF